MPQPGTVCQPDIVPFAHPSAHTVGGPTTPAGSRLCGGPSLALLAAALAVAMALAGTATLWPRDHPAVAPAGAPGPTATQPAPDPVTLQRLVDGVVEAGAPGAVVLVRTGQRTWQGVAA